MVIAIAAPTAVWVVMGGVVMEAPAEVVMVVLAVALGVVVVGLVATAVLLLPCRRAVFVGS